ncbi:hypothetical protein [Myxococcus sp. SDU36]|uniref:hypothetical protein n=1 Tax=Myxococcus sp. SDU36 TaxID=2831967 RepID=UPI002542B7CB|nr:hypothetical protein [Myxococcus sp. SDU36]WIG94030.1 hypothetical protein KGD87_26225 [Myxococcus sp. SDU36]
MPPTADWTDRATQDVANAPPDAGAPVMRCPATAATVIVQVWCPENGQLIGDTSVQLTGPTGQQGATAVDSGAVTFRPLQGGAYSLRLTLTGAHARNYRIDAPPEPFSLGESETKSLIVPVRCVIPKAVATVKRRPPLHAKAQVTSRSGEPQAPGATPPPTSAKASVTSRPPSTAKATSASKPSGSARAALSPQSKRD